MERVLAGVVAFSSGTPQRETRGLDTTASFFSHPLIFSGTHHWLNPKVNQGPRKPLMKAGFPSTEQGGELGEWIQMVK